MPGIQKRKFKKELPRAEILEASKSECVVCMSAEPITALMPCAHLCVCAECGPKLPMCPICSLGFGLVAEVLFSRQEARESRLPGVSGYEPA